MADDGPRKPFAAFVQEQRNGALHAELSEALGECVQQVAQHGKSGTVTLTIKVTANGDDATVTVTDRVVVKVPEGKRAAALYFFDQLGQWEHEGDKPGVWHVQRRLTAAEREAFSVPEPYDIRGTDEETERILSVLTEAPYLAGPLGFA